MLKIVLYGKLRQIAEDNSASGNSTVSIEYIRGETVQQLVERLGFSVSDVGEVFVNHKIADFLTVIPADDSRIGLFEEGMYLIDGGLWMHFEDEYQGTSVMKKDNLLGK